MKHLEIGDKFQILCYKHNEKMHRFWNEIILLDIKDEYMVFGNDKVSVVEANGRIRKTREPAILYFFNNRWFNVIAQLRSNGISYYCNIASPYIIENKIIKYIDYDLDLRIFPNKSFKILDSREYQYHKRIMNYSVDLDKAVNNGMEELIGLFKAKSIVFDEESNQKYHTLYNKLKYNE